MEQHIAEWQTWHDAHLADLATPFGWLSLTGLTWLEDGARTAWEDGPGVFERAGDHVHFTVAPGLSAGPATEALELLGQEHPHLDVRIDSRERMTARVAPGHSLNWILIDSVMYELLNRGGRIGVRRRDSKAPLLSRFVEVPTFAFDRRWILTAEFFPYPDPMVRTLPTALPGMELDVALSGEVRFEFEGHVHILKTHGCPHEGLSISFHDYTNGQTTAAWRRLDVGVPDAGSMVILDFNRTVNEPFAFTPYTMSCAPAPENILPLSVEAGERRPAQTLSATGITTPVMFIETSGALDSPDVLRQLADTGLEVTRVRPTDGEEAPPPAGFAALVLSGREQGEQLRPEQEAQIRELIEDVLAARLPVVGVGTAAQVLLDAAGEDTLTSGHLTLDEAESDGTTVVPLVVSAEIGGDALFRQGPPGAGVDRLGRIELDVPGSPAVSITWEGLLDRFARMIHANL